MSDTAERLAAGLAGRYEVRGELGRGGMATVYLAHDIKHGRLVAIKVFEPTLAAALGTSRFISEIEVVARLNHPNILPLFDSGEVNGLFFYVMPYVEGESLRDRLRREGQLPVEDALVIAEQVADALSHAHSRGIVHRDIKPANIMLGEGHALVADFGIARVVDSVGEERLTETGLTVGTPHYVSPEQAGGSSRLDGRSDIYSLGCVLFEMLAGEPPFTGPTVQAVLARQTLEAAPSVRITRSAVPEHVDATIRTALEKVPADRFATTLAFAEALRDERMAHPKKAVDRPAVRWVVAPLLVVVLAAAVVGQIQRRSGFSIDGDLDRNLIGVMPFRSSGAVDSSIVTPEDLVDHLQVRLPGVGGPRALDAAVVLPKWSDAGGRTDVDLSLRAMRRVAADLGAGLVLDGRIQGTPRGFSLNASVLDVEDGRELARAEGIAGPPDSLNALLDRLVVELLLELAGEDRRLAYLSSRRLPAVRSYLAGRALYAEGRYRESLVELQEALRIDSTFAVAGLAHEMAYLASGGDGYGTGYYVAAAHPDALDEADSSYLSRLASRSLDDDLLGWDMVVDRYPTFWDAAHRLGMTLFQWGSRIGRPASHERARALLDQILEAEPDFVPAMETLLSVSAANGNLPEVRRLSEKLLSSDNPPDRADYVRWVAGAVLEDSATSAEVRARLVDLPLQILERVTGAAQILGVGITDAEDAAAARRSRARDEVDLWLAVTLERALALNLGRPDRARESVAEDPYTLPFNELSYVIEGVFWDGDSTLAAEAAGRSADRLSLGDRYREIVRAMDLCTVNIWRFAQGDTLGVQRAIVTMRSSDLPAQSPVAAFMPVCEALLDAQLAHASGQGTAAEAVDRLDSLMRRGPPIFMHLIPAANLTVAQLREEQGDIDGALAAVRRRSYNHIDGPVALSTMLRQEGRLAAIVGERDAAIEAYSHYLDLRYDPEPSLASQVAQVRAALELLTGEARSR